MNASSHKELICKYGHLFWYVPEQEKENISFEALVETLLNYGDMEAVRDLIQLAGIRAVAEVFFTQTRKKRVNYFPQVTTFFTLYFTRHAPGSFDHKAV